ncbi:MAG: winged helix-turn-helix transcriptional regulator [Spirochaetes bacterium]|nr:winged helix-turn-helix transcriptional regulator [Spirochaetota bacterium]
MTYKRTRSYPRADRLRGRLGRSLSHPARIEILRLLGKDLLVSFSQIHAHIPIPFKTLSHHLQFLVKRGLLVPVHDGTRNWYGLDEGRLIGEVRAMRRFLALMGNILERRTGTGTG